MEQRVGCQCSLCEARWLSKELNRYVHPWEVMYGVGSPAAESVRLNPDAPIWVHDQVMRANEKGKTA